jgi:hypothetical protein
VRTTPAAETSRTTPGYERLSLFTDRGGIGRQGQPVYRGCGQSSRAQGFAGRHDQHDSRQWHAWKFGRRRAAALDPESIAVDGHGNLIIATLGPVRKVTHEGTIITVAGGGDCAGPACDGRAATDVFVAASAVAVDGAGNLLIADNNEDDSGCYFYLRKVSPGGITSTLAGKPGPCESSGDGGPAVASALGDVSGIAVDASGNIFLAQLFDQIVRRISPEGIITTVAGGQTGYSGDDGPAAGAGVTARNAVALDGAGKVVCLSLFWTR